MASQAAWSVRDDHLGLVIETTNVVVASNARSAILRLARLRRENRPDHRARPCCPQAIPSSKCAISVCHNPQMSARVHLGRSRDQVAPGCSKTCRRQSRSRATRNAGRNVQDRCLMWSDSARRGPTYACRAVAGVGGSAALSGSRESGAWRQRIRSPIEKAASAGSGLTARREAGIIGGRRGIARSSRQSSIVINGGLTKRLVVPTHLRH